MKTELIRETCPYCKGSGFDEETCPCCEELEILHGHDGENYCSECGIVEWIKPLDCPECGGKGYLNELDLLEQQHNLACNEADNFNKAKKERS